MAPRWISWLLIGVMAYLVITGNQAQREQARAVDEAAQTASSAGTNPADYTHLQALTDADRWKRAMDPTYEGATTFRDITEGKGSPASCGSEVTILLRGTLSDGGNFDPAHNETTPVTFRLGNAPYPALNQALLGMSEGGIRQITAPPQQVYANGTATTRDNVMLRVTLQTIAPPHTTERADQIGLRVMAEGTQGTGTPTRCGDTAPFDVTLWDATGARAWGARALPITLGAGALPTPIEHALVGMKAGEVRTILIPAALQQKADGKGMPEPLKTALAGKTLRVLTFTRTPEAADSEPAKSPAK